MTNVPNPAAPGSPGLAYSESPSRLSAPTDTKPTLTAASQLTSKVTAAALALAFLAAACSGESGQTTTAEAAESSDATASVPSDNSGDSEDTVDQDGNQETPEDTAAESTAESTAEDTAAEDDGSASMAEPQVWLAPEEAEAAAMQNLGNLQLSDDVRDTEVLSVASGGVSSLGDAVTGDRPVLLWFYAPH